MNQLQRALSPALTGYIFQQTALIGMLPVLALQLDLKSSEVGLAISAGLIVSAAIAPLLAGSMTLPRLRAALIAMVAASVALVGLLLLPQPVGMAFAILLAIRCVQGTAAAIILSVAQAASVGSKTPAAALARVQVRQGLGRVFGAALIGPLVRLSIAAPVLPAMIGATVSVYRLRTKRLDFPSAASPGIQTPWLAALAVPFLTQSAVGAGHLGLGPMLAQTRAPEQATTIVGFCLAAGYLALLLVHYRLTAAGTTTRPAAAVLVLALTLPVLSDRPVVLIVATALAAAASGLLIARYLARVIMARPEDARQNSAWQSSALLAGLGTGAGTGSLVLPLAPSAPFMLGAAFSLITLLICMR